MKVSTNEQLTTYRILDATIGFADMASPFNWGADGAGHDVKLFGAAAGAYLLWDESDNRLELDGADINLQDTDFLQFGDAQDVAVQWDGAKLEILPAANDTGSINIGNGTKDMDVQVFLGAAGKYVLFDVGTSLLTLSAGVQLDVDDATDATSALLGSIHTAGGIATAKALWVGTTSRLVGVVTVDNSVNATLTAPTTVANAVFGLVTASANWTGNLVGVRGRVTVTATGAIQSATGVHAAVRIESESGPGTGLTCALNAEIQSITSVIPNAIVYIQSLPQNALTNFANVPYLVFSETVIDGTGSNILFEVGHAPAGTVPTLTSGTLFYRDTLQIAVNKAAGVRTAYYIPLSTAQGSYTTAYPIVTTSTIAQTIASTAIVATTVIGTSLALTGLFSGPPQRGTLVGLKVDVTGTGDNGMLAYGIYGLYTTVGKVMTGFYAAGAFETVSDNDTDQCDSAVVDLRDNDNGTAGHPASSYIRIRQKGSQNSAVGRRNFVNFYNEDEASIYSSGRMLVLTSPVAQTHAIRCFIDDAVIYLMATTNPPAA